MNIKEFTTLANKERLKNKNDWVILTHQISEKDYKNPITVNYKAFGTWIQILMINDKKLSSPMNMSITDYKNWLNENLSLEMIFNNDELNILNIN